MGTTELQNTKPKTRKRPGPTLLEKLEGLAGADRSRGLPADTSVQYKRLLDAKLSAKHSR